MESAQVAEFWEANAETWTRHVRAGYDIYRDTLNTPAFLHMLPPIRSLSGLDIGFGEGSNARRLSAVLHPPPLFRPALPPGPARCGRQGKSHRSSRLFDTLSGLVDTWWFSTLPDEDRRHVEPFRTPRFHRTLSGSVEIICLAGLTIEKFGEPCASPELAAKEPAVADTRVAPLFLHIRARKPAAAQSI
jgi:hypothetical protein